MFKTTCYFFMFSFAKLSFLLLILIVSYPIASTFKAETQNICICLSIKQQTLFYIVFANTLKFIGVPDLRSLIRKKNQNEYCKRKLIQMN